MWIFFFFLCGEIIILIGLKVHSTHLAARFFDCWALIAALNFALPQKSVNKEELSEIVCFPRTKSRPGTSAELQHCVPLWYFWSTSFLHLRVHVPIWFSRFFQCRSLTQKTNLPRWARRSSDLNAGKGVFDVVFACENARAVTCSARNWCYTGQLATPTCNDTTLREKIILVQHPIADDFLRYLQCCNALEVFESDSKA